MQAQIGNLWRILGVALFFLSCQKSLIPPNHASHGVSQAASYNFLCNNSYYPGLKLVTPLNILRQFRPSSAPQHQLQITGDILLVPTKDGKIEAYDLREKKHVGRHKLPAKIRANLVPVNGKLLIALEYGKRSLFLFDPLKNKRIWIAELGSIKASPKVLGDKVYVATLYRGLFSLELKSGKKIWRFNPESQLHTSPAIFSSHLFQVTEKGELIALGVDSGAEQWRVDLGDAGLIPPVVVNHRVLGATPKGILFAFSFDGKKLWEYRCGALLRRALASSGEKVVIADQNGRIHCVHLEDGRLLWQYDARIVFGTDPFLTEDYVILGTLDNRLLFLDIISGDPVWELELFGRVRTDPVAWKDHLIVSSEDNYVYLLANPELDRSSRR